MTGASYVQAAKKIRLAESGSHAAGILDQRPVALAQRRRVELAAQSPGAQALRRQRELANASVQRKLTVAPNVTKHIQEIGIPDYDLAAQTGDQAFIREFNHYHVLAIADNIPWLRQFIEHDFIKVSIAQGIHVNDTVDTTAYRPERPPERRPHQTLKVSGHPGDKISSNGPSWHVIWKIENGKLAYLDYTQENEVDAKTFFNANAKKSMPDFGKPMEYEQQKYAGYMYVPNDEGVMDQTGAQDNAEESSEEEPTLREIALGALANSPEGSGWYRIKDGKKFNSERAIHRYVLRNIDHPDNLGRLSIKLYSGMSAQGMNGKMRSIYRKYLAICASLMREHHAHDELSGSIIGYLRHVTGGL